MQLVLIVTVTTQKLALVFFFFNPCFKLALAWEHDFIDKQALAAKKKKNGVLTCREY